MPLRDSMCIVERADQFGDISLAMRRMTNWPAKLPFIVDAEQESLAAISLYAFESTHEPRPTRSFVSPLMVR